MAGTLPDEIISEILSPALKVSEEMFSDIREKSPFASSSASSSAALLVCKAWLRVATPLLYHVVVLRSKAQAYALQAALRLNPDLGRFIKRLRLEGGFGAPVHQILQKTPNITDIYISLLLYASDSSDGLIRGLPCINPTRIIIFDNILKHGPLKNKQVTGLISAIEKCAEKWSNLNAIVFPYYGISATIREPFVRALVAIPTVKAISVPNYSHGSRDLPIFMDWAQKPALESMELGRKHLEFARSIPPNSRLASLVRWTKYTPQTDAAPQYQPVIPEPVSPSFKPLEAATQLVKDRIWSRILFFAMLPLETAERDRDAHHKRLLFLLVSQMFHRLALPYLYRYVTFPREAPLHRFVKRLADTPNIGAHVHEMKIGNYRYERNIGRIAVDFTRLFPYTPRLRRLLGDGETRMSWAALTALADTAGGTLEELLGFEFHETDGESESPAVFERFTALRSLSWDGGYRPVLTAALSFFDRKVAVPKNGLPALEFLHAKPWEAIDVLAEMELPNLRRATFEWEFRGWGVPFLQNHGYKLVELDILGSTTINRDYSILQLCPNVTTLSYRLGSYTTKDNLGWPTEGFQHQSLTTLKLYKVIQPNKVLEAQAWEHFFAHANFVCFPALQEVRVASLEWPTTENAISKSGWVKLAEKLMQRGVYLADASGARWRPRLKTSKGSKR
ncbi:hypothetical protein B0H11DRAFT_2279620 [Mycena galericulata]|nr:hypothetical protein B0H11DRAFT_2279620 [Mycena galericulata]